MNIRNYERLELDLTPGMVLLEGENGQGKSNLLEALYILAIAKSSRTSSERELVRWQSRAEGTQAQISAVAQRDGGRMRVQIDFRSVAPATDEQVEGAEVASLQKQVRVNGVPRRASDLVGEINAVMFSAQDLELVLGPPAGRRRYLDILISQVDRRYLKTLQRYHRVVSQRNNLLKALREGRSQPGELRFWDDELVDTGSHITARRAEIVRALSDTAGPIHRELTGGGEELRLAYRPSVDIGMGASKDELGQSLRQLLEAQRTREVAQGFTVSGPHRDDLQMLLDEVDAGLYASRGQCRTMILAVRLAEASFLRNQRGQEPILLLDDVLSELDTARRLKVLDMAAQYEQCLITTTDVEPIDGKHLSQMARFVVRQGRVEPVSTAGNGGT